MNRFSNRAISLILAVVFLFSAAGISFMLLFKGTTVFAANPLTISDCRFYDKNDSIISTLSSNTNIKKLVLTLDDTELATKLDTDKFNSALDAQKQAKADLEAAQKELEEATTEEDKAAAKIKVDNAKIALNEKSFFLSWNTDTFSKSTSPATQVNFSEATELKGGIGSTYTITITDLVYTGKTDNLIMDITYPKGVSVEHPESPIIRKINEQLKNVSVNSDDYSSSSRHSKKDDDDDSSSSKVDIAPPTPNIIVSEYSYGGGTVTAASNFALTVKFTNTSQKLPIDNIVMKVSVPEAFTMTSSSNTYYIDKMSKQSSVERTINLSVKPNAEPISHPIKLNFTFEAVIDEARKQFTSEQEISIPVAQLDRFQLNTVEVPAELYIGDDTSISATFVNKGKTPVYNVSAEITGNISQPGQRQFIGNVEGGKEDSADFLLGALEPGMVSGEIIITYEDANMNVNELRSPFTANAIAMNTPPMEGEMTMNPEDMPPETTVWYKNVPVWGWMVGGVVLVIFAAFAIKLIRARRQKKLEEQDEDI